MKISYNDGWEEFLKESNIQELISKGESALARSRAFSSGKGKGKSKGKSKNIPSHSASNHNFAQAPWHKKWWGPRGVGMEVSPSGKCNNIVFNHNTSQHDFPSRAKVKHTRNNSYYAEFLIGRASVWETWKSHLIFWRLLHRVLRDIQKTSSSHCKWQWYANQSIFYIYKKRIVFWVTIC